MSIMPIERGKIREYALATGAPRPEYLDAPDAPIPPTFLATVIFWTPIGSSVFQDQRVLDACAEAGIGADMENLLSLEQEYIFHGPVPRAGQTLTTSEELRDVSIKQGRQGPLVIVRFVVSFHDADGTLRAECCYTSAYKDS